MPARSRRRSQVDHWRVQIEKDIRRAQTHSVPFISSVPISDAQRSQAHYVRLVSSTREPPAYLYMLLILVCSTAIFFITAFTVHGIPARLRIPVIAVVTFLLVATLAVIVDLSHPYDGVSRWGQASCVRSRPRAAATISCCGVSRSRRATRLGRPTG